MSATLAGSPPTTRRASDGRSPPGARCPATQARPRACISLQRRPLGLLLLLPLLLALGGCDVAAGLARRQEARRFAPYEAEGTFFVSPAGDDDWSGTPCCPDPEGTDGPFATLSRAREVARSLGKEVPRRIIVRAGAYDDVTLTLYAGDSNLTIETVEGEEAVLYGGHRVTGWVKEPDTGFWRADLPGVREGRWAPRMLQVNGRLCDRARLPAEGAFTHESRFDVPWLGAGPGGWARPPRAEESTTLRYRTADLGPWLELANVEVTVYHAWDESTVGIRRLDPETRTLTFASPAGHPPGAFADWNPHARTYVVWNVREGMTRPGQWYLDRVAGQAVYWPLPGEDIAQAEILIPTTTAIITLSAAGGGALRNLTLRRLTLAVADAPLMAAGFGAENLDGAITGDATVIDARFEGLMIRNVAGHAIKLRNTHNRSVTITGCTVEETGGGGIYLTGTENLITENLVARVGQMNASAIGIFGGGDRNDISHNDIHDTPYTGINGGGGRDNRIAANDIARVMQVLNDGGAIYSIFARDLVIEGNYVHDIAEGQGAAHAYYIDEQSQGCAVVGNLAVGVASPSSNHWANNNRIEGNVFVVDGDMRLHFARSKDYTFAHNVLYASGAIEFHNTGAIAIFRENVVYSAVGEVWAMQYSADSYQMVAIDRLPDSRDLRQADPRFVNPGAGDFTFAASSPALGLGITPLDVSAAGRTGD